MGENPKSLKYYYVLFWKSVDDFKELGKSNRNKLIIFLVVLIPLLIIICFHSSIISLYLSYSPNRDDHRPGPKIAIKNPEPEGSVKKSESYVEDTLIVKDLRKKRLMEELYRAMYGYNYENRKEQIDGLFIFSNIVDKLSEGALKQLDKGLIERAAKDDSAGLHKQAIDKYRSLFSPYVDKDIKKSKE